MAMRYSQQLAKLYSQVCSKKAGRQLTFTFIDIRSRKAIICQT
jgi:hypothetical protein